MKSTKITESKNKERNCLNAQADNLMSEKKSSDSSDFFTQEFSDLTPTSTLVSGPEVFVNEIKRLSLLTSCHTEFETDSSQFKANSLQVFWESL